MNSVLNWNTVSTFCFFVNMTYARWAWTVCKTCVMISVWTVLVNKSKSFDGLNVLAGPSLPSNWSWIWPHSQWQKVTYFPNCMLKNSQLLLKTIFSKQLKNQKLLNEKEHWILKITALKEIISLFFILKMCNFSQIPQNDHNFPNS